MNDPHFTIQLQNHRTGERLKIELSDLLFSSRKFALQVNGKVSGNLAYVTKTQLWDRLRKWMVREDRMPPAV